MQIQTRAFGPIEIDENQVLTLTEPMVGFPGYDRFVVLDPEPEVPFKWFQSVDREDLCFLVADPRQFFPDYTVSLRDKETRELQITEESDAAVAVILNVPDDLTAATANLLAPVVINAGRKLARQVILEGSGYPVRARLLPEQKKACEAG